MILRATMALEVGLSGQSTDHAFRPSGRPSGSTAMTDQRLLILLCATCSTCPDLHDTDDEIANGTFVPPPGRPRSYLLALFHRAARVDYSLYRLRHYTGTDADHFRTS